MTWSSRPILRKTKLLCGSIPQRGSKSFTARSGHAQPPSPLADTARGTYIHFAHVIHELVDLRLLAPLSLPFCELPCGRNGYDSILWFREKSVRCFDSLTVRSTGKGVDQLPYLVFLSSRIQGLYVAIHELVRRWVRKLREARFPRPLDGGLVARLSEQVSRLKTGHELHLFAERQASPVVPAGLPGESSVLLRQLSHAPHC